MDPFCQAAARLRRRCAVFWKLNRAPVLRVVAPAARRQDVAGSLRWEEAQPECLRPLIVVADPFEDAESYFAAVSRRVVEAYHDLSKAARDAGIAMIAVTEATSSVPVVGAVTTARRASEALPAGLHGLTVLLLPSRVADEVAWTGQISALARTVSVSSAGAGDPGGGVRWMVHDAPAGPLESVLGEGVELPVDEGGVFDFWKAAMMKPEPRASASGPNGTRHRARRSRAREMAALRAHLVTAADRLRAREPGKAIVSFRAAQKICAGASLPVEEASILMAVAGMELAAAAPGEAAASYRRSAELASRAGAPGLACQARLGEGGAELLSARPQEAAVAFELAAELAESAGAGPLRVEALRMAAIARATR